MCTAQSGCSGSLARPRLPGARLRKNRERPLSRTGVSISSSAEHVPCRQIRAAGDAQFRPRPCRRGSRSYLSSSPNGAPGDLVRPLSRTGVSISSSAEHVPCRQIRAAGDAHGASKTNSTTRATSPSAKTPRASAATRASSPDYAASLTISCGSTNPTPSHRIATPPRSEASNP
jgi:hypothetical protein